MRCPAAWERAVALSPPASVTLTHTHLLTPRRTWHRHGGRQRDGHGCGCKGGVLHRRKVGGDRNIDGLALGHRCLRGGMGWSVGRWAGEEAGMGEERMEP